MDQKDSQRLVYNQRLLNDLRNGLGTKGFNKIKTLKDLVNYRFVQALNLRQNELILDVGCNAGELLNKIVATYQTKGYGLDISDKTIELARKYNPYGNDYVVGDAENLPYPKDFFDVVVSTDVLEHVPNPRKVIGEILRVLKPGGRIYIYCISKRNFLSARWFMQKFHHKHGWGDLGDHQQNFLVEPRIFARMPGLKVRKIFYFDSFFMLLFDEFMIRPFLWLISKNRLKQQTADKKFEIDKSDYPIQFNRGASIYLFFLQIVYYLALILDSPWRLFKSSDAILFSGQKK